jgi:hypothetical protein
MSDIYKEDGPTTKAVLESARTHIAGEDRLISAILILARAVDELRDVTGLTELFREQEEARKGYEGE